MILIIGGTGYLGGRLCKAFEDVGIHHCIGSRKSIPGIENHRVCDFSNINSLHKSLDGVKKIIFTAGPGSSDTFETVGCDLVALDCEFRNFLNSVTNSEVKEIIYISSIHVYGENLFGLVDETTEPIPTIDYGRYHLARENLLEDYTKENDISFLSLRLANGFGAPANSNNTCWNLLINSLAKSLVFNGSFTFNSSPNISRDFFPLSLIEDFLVEIITESKPLPSKVLNFSMGHSLTLKEVSSRVNHIFLSLTGKSSEVKFLNKNNVTDTTNKGDNFEINNAALLHAFGKKPFDLSSLDQEIKQLLQQCMIDLQ
jgi:UDP-glucose 4-epimerase